MRLLYAWDADIGARSRASPSRAGLTLHPRRIERQSLPLHRVCQYRARGAFRDRAKARARHFAGPSVSAIATTKVEVRHEDGGAMTIPDFTPQTVLKDHFTVAHPPERVFGMFGDVGQVAACLPGASLTGTPTPERAEGMIRVELGPISASFRGVARIERDLENLSGRIVGTGSDRRSRSSTQGEIRYHLVPIEHGAATRVELTIGYSLRGMLAQIAREGLVRDLAARLTADFARNLDRHLSGIRQDGSAGRQDLNGVSLLINLLRARARNAIRRVLGR